MIDIDKIYNEDCLEGMKRIADGAVDCIITDIPYNEVNRTDNGLRNLDKKSADIGLFDVTELTRTLCAKSRGSVYMFCGINQVSDIRRTMSECKLSTRLLIWEKTNPSPMNGDKIWLSGIDKENLDDFIDELADLNAVVFHIAGILGLTQDDLLIMAADKVKGREKDPNYKRKHPHNPELLSRSKQA